VKVTVNTHTAGPGALS